MKISTLQLIYFSFMIICFIVGMFVGIIIGFDRGQYILFEGMDGIFRDANINITIDINETHLVEAFIPIFNQTIQESMKNE